MVRFWLANRPSEDKVETAFLAARLALVEQVANASGLERFLYLGDEESIYWFEGTLTQVAQTVGVLGEEYGLSGLAVEVSTRDLAEKWPVEVKTGGLALSNEEMPGKGDRRLRRGRRQEGRQRQAPEPDLESTMKRDFMPR
jgi:hypothetical protein